jgi:hypothetical protein
MRLVLVKISELRNWKISQQQCLHSNYKIGLVKWIQDFGDDFTDFVKLGQKIWKDDDVIKQGYIQNAQNSEPVDEVQTPSDMINGTKRRLQDIYKVPAKHL